MTLTLALLACSTPEATPASPGRVVLHRLNRAEYDNTVRDLLGTSLRPSDDFPADDFALGFDNVADVLSLSALHFELYDRAADLLLDDLLGMGTLPPEVHTFEPEAGDTAADNGAVWDASMWVLWHEGALTATVWAPSTGDYTLAADAYGLQAGDEPARMAFLVDGATVAEVDVTAEDDPAPYEVAIALTEGRHTVGVAFTNDLDQPPDLDRNLVVDRLELTGPLGVPRTRSEGYAHVVDCDPADVGEAACVEHVVRTLGRRAWRRPLSEDEADSILALYAEARVAGGSWEEGLRAAIRGLLLSPFFLYKVELDPIDGPRPLAGFELATRLSYFLWSSTPDDRLLDLAQAGTLEDPDVLEAEARRMLADPKAQALVDNLGGQWLGIRKVDEAEPSADVYPDWNEALRASMEDEIRGFVGRVLLADRPVLELFTEDTTVVDDRLAVFYGLPAGGEVQVPERTGLLARGGLMAALAYPTRTSPVIRGNWVLGNLVCAPPPDPPPGVPALDVPEPGEPVSLREQLERHRADPVCASCHAEMDPIGLALEAFDGIGRFRTVDENGIPIDASGDIPGLGAFEDAAGMQRLLATDPRVPACVVQKTFTYALGRGPEDADAALLAELTEDFAASGWRFRELAVDVVRSRPFRYRLGDAP